MKLTDLTILYEDTHILVCIKPAGIATQSARASSPDMVSLLKNHLYKNGTEKKEPYLAVIHRLDQPVEGILVFAKTPFAAKELNKELQGSGFGKHYHARVVGKPPKDSDVLEDYMVKDGRTNTSRICSKDTEGAKLARLTYTVIPEAIASKDMDSKDIDSKDTDTNANTTLLDILLDTGRHHQIRVQLANMGCPIVEDQKYGADAALSEVKRTTPCRGKTKLELCAYKLEFHHPKTKKNMSFSI